MLRRKFKLAARQNQGTFDKDKWSCPFQLLREKWREVPAAGITRVMTESLLQMDNEELLKIWRAEKLNETTGDRFDVRGWYHLIYKDVLRDKMVMDVGCGLGIDGITFAWNGARVIFVV